MWFNGIDLSPYLKIKNITGRGIAEYETSTLTPPGMDGAHFERKRRPMRVLGIEADIRAVNREELRIKIDDLNGILSVDEPVPISFSDEPNKTYFGIPEASGEDDEYFFKHSGTLTIICPDPYKYGPQTESGLTGQGTIINVPGTAETKPTFELDVLAPITFAMVSDGERYMLAGTIVEDHQEVFQTKELRLEERGETLDEWDAASSDNIDSFLGGISGSLGYDGTGIFPESYGDGDNMHGPGAIRDIGDSLQDFEIETTFDTISNYDRDGYRMEIYMFDEGMNNLGKIGINDNSQHRTERIGLGRVGEYQNDEYTDNSSYIINQSNYKRTDLYQVALMYLRVRRVGNQFTFYIAEIQNGKHYNTIERTYTDRDNEHLGRLKYVQLFIGNWQDRPRTFRTRINYIRVHEIIPPADDTVPYIAHEGDTITFDHENEEILLNGEDATDLKDFGGEYFELPPGDNELATLPDGDIEGVLRFRPRYK